MGPRDCTQNCAASDGATDPGIIRQVDGAGKNGTIHTDGPGRWSGSNPASASNVECVVVGFSITPRLGIGRNVDGATVAKSKRTASLRMDANTFYEIRNAGKITIYGADRKSQRAPNVAFIIDRAAAGERIGDGFIVGSSCNSAHRWC